MYTKGEWKVTDVAFTRYFSYYGKKSGARCFITVTDNLIQVAEAQGDTQEEAEANAHLIAQSPRMAKFLENLCAEYEDYGEIDELFYTTAKEILKEVEHG